MSKRPFLSTALFLFLIFLCLFFPSKTKAVTKTSGDLRLTAEEPMFPSSIIWYPGLGKEEVMTVENLGGEEESVYIRAENTSETGSLADVLYFNLQENGSDLYGGSSTKTLKQFWDEGDIFLFKLGANKKADFSAGIEMDSSAGNQYQGKKADFDLVVGFEGAGEEVSVTAAGDGDGGGGGAVAGAAAPVCYSSKPNMPGNLSASAGSVPGEVDLFWTAPLSPPGYTYFLIAYSDTSDFPKWGNPDVGTATNYTVSGLSAGTYYFWVRAGNGCMPGDFAGPVSAALGAGAPGAAMGVPVEGFLPGVLGEATPSAKISTFPTKKVPGKVKGSEDKNEKQALQALLVVLSFFVIISIYFIRERREEKNK